MTFIATLSAVTLLNSASAYAVEPKVPSGAKSENAKIVTGTSRFRMSEGYAFSFERQNCWGVSGNEEDPTDSERVSIAPDVSCPESERGSWSIEIADSRPFGSIEEYWKGMKLSPNFPIFYEGKIKAGEIGAVIFNQVHPEKGLIDRKDQYNYTWTVLTRCRDTNVTIGYVDYLNKEQRAQARKHAVIPKPFKAFIEGFRCEKHP